MVKETLAGPSLAAAARGWSWSSNCGVGLESCSDWGAGAFTGSDILRGEERETVVLDWRSGLLLAKLLAFWKGLIIHSPSKKKSSQINQQYKNISYFSF